MPNFVAVTMNAVNADASPIENMSLTFTPSDILWSVEFDLVGGIQPVRVVANGQITTWTFNLYAMDNADVSTNWYWIISGEVNGVAIVPRELNVLFANGATQNLATLLAASTVIT